MKRLVYLLLVVSVAVLLMIATSCSKSTEVEDQLETIVSSETVVLEHDIADQIIDVTNDKLIFPDTVDPEIYQPGRVIVAVPTDNAPDGLLRKVESYVEDGDQIIVTTVQARLEDIFDQLDLDFSQDLRTTDITESKQLHNGVTFSPDNRNPYSFDYTISLLGLSGEEGSIDITGNLSLSLGYDFSVRIRFLSGLENLDFKGVINSTGELVFFTGTGFSQEHELELYEHNFSRVWIQVGAVPVIIRPKVVIKLELDASGKASVTAGIETNASVSAVLNYKKPNWSQKSDRDISYDYFPPELSGNLEVNVSAGPTFELNLYGITGPFVSGLGYSKLEADINECPWWTLWGGFKVDAGVNFDALGYQADYTVEDIIDYSVVLAYGLPEPQPIVWSSIPAGDYTYGQPTEEKNYTSIETIAYNYEIMTYEVTNAQYLAYLQEAYDNGDIWVSGIYVMGYYPGDHHFGAGDRELFSLSPYVLENTSSIFYSNGEFTLRYPSAFTLEDYLDHPVVSVTWFGAWHFSNYYGWRLPTEQEWEKAARGMTGSTYPWGGNIDGSRANYSNSGDPYDQGTTPVGFYNGDTHKVNGISFSTTDSPSPYGVYDMAGNVHNWTDSFFHPDHFSRVVRGGGWGSNTYNLSSWIRRVSNPEGYGPVGMGHSTGFRSARTLD